MLQRLLEPAEGLSLSKAPTPMFSRRGDITKAFGCLGMTPSNHILVQTSVCWCLAAQFLQDLVVPLSSC